MKDINKFIIDYGTEKMYHGITNDEIKKRLAKIYKTDPSNVGVWKHDTKDKLCAHITNCEIELDDAMQVLADHGTDGLFVEDDENNEPSDPKDKIVLNLKKEVAELSQKYHYDFNHSDDGFTESMTLLGQKYEDDLKTQVLLESLMVLLKDELNEKLSKYLYEPIEDVTKWSPKLAEDVAEVFGIPAGWVEFYFEDMDMGALKVLIRPKMQVLTPEHSQSPSSLGEKTDKELKVEHRLQARMDELDAGGITNINVIKASFIEVMTEEYDVDANDVVIEKRTEDLFSISTRYWSERRFPLLVRVGRIFEENEEEPTKSVDILDSMKKSFIRACTAPYGDTTYTLRMTYGDDINSQALKEHIARDTGFEPEDIKFCFDDNGAFYISIER